MRAWLRSLVNAVQGKVPGKTNRLDAATRMARDADFSDRRKPTRPAREPLRKSDMMAELQHIPGRRE